MYLKSNMFALNDTYLNSFPCILKLIQLLCNTIVTIIVTTSYSPIYTAYLIASIGTLVLSSLIFLIKIYNIDKYMKNVPWNKIEISYYTTWSVYYLIIIGQSIDLPSYQKAQIFALFGVITFMIDSSISYTEMNNKKYSCDSNLSKEENENFQNTKTLIV